MADNVTDLVVKFVERRLTRNSFTRAVEMAAEALGMSEDRILRAWFRVTTAEQERILDFLSHDHGHFRLVSPVVWHPVRDWRTDVGQADYLALFDDHHVWLIYHDGSHAFVGLHTPTAVI